MERTETPTRRLPFGLDRLRLRFGDPALEAALREERFRNNITNIRFAFLAGIGVSIAWGALLRPHMLAPADRRLDAQMRSRALILMPLPGILSMLKPPLH